MHELRGKRNSLSFNECSDKATLNLRPKMLKNTYGSFILMKTRHVKKETNTQTKPRDNNKNLFSFDIPTAFDLSKIMKPRPPTENRKLDARPSIMYCPLTRYGMKAT